MYFQTFVILMLTKGSFALPSYNRRQDAEESEESSFLCNSYTFVNEWITANLNYSAINAKGAEIIQDQRLNYREAVEMVEVWCREYAQVANKLQRKAADCPNFNDINNAMNHLGPACTRSGTVSSFGMDLLQHFMDLNLKPECSSQIFGVNVGCNDKYVPMYSGTRFLQDLWAAEIHARRGLKCTLDYMNSITTCGTVSPGFILSYVTDNTLFGIELKYSDLF